MIGKTISHYKILEKLGSGSMGTVYKAEDTKLKRIVALKFLPTHLATGEISKKRFLHEAQAASALHHPNIITIFDIHEEKDEVFIIMEYCDGQMLTEKLKDGPLKQKDLLDMGIGIAEGLNAAHKADITHRDIKSQNIIVSEDCPPKIIDFGIAKQIGMTDITKDGTTLGTQCYMSPEQLHGSTIDQRSDIFSFGVVLYEMATGKLPFSGKHDAEILYSVVNEDPIPITTLNPNMDEELHRIVDKALKKDVKDRYQHVDELLADLRNLKKRKQPKKSTKKYSWWHIPAYILGFAVIALLLYSTFIKKDTLPTEHVPGSKSIAVLPFTAIDRTEQSEIFGDGIHDDILTQLSKIHDLKVIARTSMMLYRNTDKSIKEIASELNVNTILEGSVRRVGDSIRIVTQLIDPSTEDHIWAETYDRDYADIFSIQSDVAKNIALALEATLTPKEKRAIDAIPTKNLKAFEYYIQGKINHDNGDTDSAEELLVKAIDLDPGFALAHALLSRTYLLQGYRNLTQKTISLAKSALNKAIAIDPLHPDVLLAEGFYSYVGFRNYDEAINKFSLALKDNPNNSDLIHVLSGAKRRNGNWDEALQLARKASDLDPQNYGNSLWVSMVAITMRNWEVAENYANRALLINPSIRGAYFAKSDVALFGRGDLNEAKSILLNSSISLDEFFIRRSWLEFLDNNFEAALKIRQEEYVRKDRLSDIYDAWYKGIYLKFMDNNELASTYFDSIVIHGINLLEDNINAWLIHAYLGQAYAYLGSKDKALRETEVAANLMPMSLDAVDAIYVRGINVHTYIQTDEHNMALDEIEHLLSVPSGLNVQKLEIDPRFNPLRDNPRFQEVIKKYTD